MIQWNNICADLSKKMTDQHMDLFERSFKLVKVQGDKVVIGYVDSNAYDILIPLYEMEIFNAVCMAMGTLATVSYRKMNSLDVKTNVSKNSNLTYKNKGSFVGTIIGSIICVVIAIMLIIVGANFIENMNFKETYYSVSSPKVYDSFRVISLSDLHSVQYGNDNEKLVNRIKVLDPDMIVMTGDMIDSSASVETVTSLCTALAKIAPTYYIYGNNENEMAFGLDMTLDTLNGQFKGDCEKLYKADSGIRKQLEATGVKVLFNEKDTVKLGTTYVDVFGVLTSNPSAFWDYAGENFNTYISDNTPGHFKLTLSHEPLLFETLTEETWGDLALCGDTHGGVIRVPVLGSVYSRNYGLFPERDENVMVHGLYKVGTTPVIVNSGLINSGVIRIDNPPEIDVIDVNRY